MNKFEKILLTLFFIELFIGGGGRLIDFGVLSIRQVLFIMVILMYVFRLVKGKNLFNKEVSTFVRLNSVTVSVYLLLVWFIVSSILGVINSNPLSIIVMDFFRVSYFLIYFPLAYYISSERFTKQSILKYIKYSALVVAIFTITISLLGKTIFSNNFVPFYNFMNTIMNDDLFFRPSNSVFYKSHLFVLIGLILSLNSLFGKKYTKLDIINIILCTVSLVWSETRGFLIAFMISSLTIIILDSKLITDSVKGWSSKLGVLWKTKSFIKKSAILFSIIILVPFMYKHMTLERFAEEVPLEESAPPITTEQNDIIKEAEKETVINDVSVGNRMEYIMDSKDILFSDPIHFIFGTGYGGEIAGRLGGIETSMLDIWVEQGIIGLAIWLILCFLVFYNYYIAYKKGASLETSEIALMAGFTGMILLTNINPFINNPIGISFFVIILILSQNKKERPLDGEIV